MSQTQHIAVQKQIRVMENRLDKSLVRFNSALATNSQLRTMIDHLRQERSVFEGIYKKLQRVRGRLLGLIVYIKGNCNPLIELAAKILKYCSLLH